MRLKLYLKARGEPEIGFARRAGLSQAAVHFIANHDEADPRISTCSKIVLASRQAPAPDGGTVTWEDLHPQEKPMRNTPVRIGRKKTAKRKKD